MRAVKVTKQCKQYTIKEVKGAVCVYRSGRKIASYDGWTVEEVKQIVLRSIDF